MVLKYITSTLQPNIALSLHETWSTKNHNRIVDQQIFFQTRPPKSVPPVHLKKKLFLNPSLGGKNPPKVGM